MNLPNKLTVARICMAIVIIILLLFPFSLIGFEFPKYMISGVMLDLRFVIAGVLFIVASLTDFLDGHIARKYNLVTDFGKMADAIADKVLVNSSLIILATTGDIHPIVPVVMITRDSIVNSIKMVAGNKGQVVAAIKSGKWKTACTMVGIALVYFSNLPFEIWGLDVAGLLLMIGTVLSIVSGIQYYYMNRKLIFGDK